MEMAMLVKVLLGGCLLVSGVVMMGCCKQNICGKNCEPKTVNCTIVAHRGFSSIAPENTLIAMVKGCEAKADGCELDVHQTKDGHIVVMHDGDVKRTTDGEGKIAEMTLAEIKKLDAGSWKGPEYKGEPVPTLEEVLKRVKAMNGHVVVEIKADGIAAGVLAAIKAQRMQDHVTVISFSEQAVKDVRALDPKMPIGFLYGSDKTPGETPMEKAKWLAEKTRTMGAGIIDIAWNLVTPELVQEFHRQGMMVWAWTVDDPDEMAKLMSMGVDSITTNKPDVGLSIRKQQIVQ
jgi:glycerophosphoryl diester phosphodiesterase